MGLMVSACSLRMKVSACRNSGGEIGCGSCKLGAKVVGIARIGRGREPRRAAPLLLWVHIQTHPASSITDLTESTLHSLTHSLTSRNSCGRTDGKPSDSAGSTKHSLHNTK